LPFVLRKNKIDIYHAAGNLGVPIFTSTPTILTVHDLIPLSFQNYFRFSRIPFISKNLYGLNTIFSCYKAKKIITVSKFVKKEVFSVLKVSTEKIEVVYSGVRMSKIGRLPRDLTSESYILDHGGINIRKNLEGLIKAFVLIRKSFLSYKLVITGENLEMKIKLKNLVNKLGLESSVIFVGYVSDEVLGSLIKHAKVVCYPSFREGFGMPILEAFKIGTPVVCSNTTSLPEIAGGAAVLVDPNNYKDIAFGVISVLKSKKRSLEMIKRGKMVVEKFQWSDAINETLTVYKEVLN